MKKNILRQRRTKNNTWKKPSWAGNDIVLWLIQWEKSFGMMEHNQKYTFMVPTSVNKIDIARWFEELYGKTPLSVNTIVLPSKSGSRRLKRRSFKKAIITLNADDKIEII